MADVKQFEAENGANNGNAAPPGRAKHSYPYFNMDSSLEVAKAVHENGGGSCTPDQLAAFLGYKSVKSGTYQTRTSAARQFGFIRYDAGSISVTDRGQKILSPVMPEDATAARAEAFLSVELFNEVYQKFHGQTLPPEVGLKNLLQNTYGLSSDRAGPAVRVLMESADQGGFFSLTSGDRNRLIKPATKASKPSLGSSGHQSSTPAPEDRPKQPPGGGGGEQPPGVHSAIIGLLRVLPAPGTPWSSANKKSFKTAFEATLDLIYPTEDEGEGGNE